MRNGIDLRRPLIWVERLLLAVAVLSLGYFSYVSIEAQLYQAYENRALNDILSRAAHPPDRTGKRPPRDRPQSGAVLGRLEITRLGVAAVVRAGTDARTLRLAVGHIPGTSVPGDGGNVGLAAHRDTFFRRLGEIRPDDEIRMVTPEGTFVYRVERTDVVSPRDVWVLDPTETPVLTLVTCYPFTYTGAAPERFVVRARLDSPARIASARG
jgi:sortase A